MLFDGTYFDQIGDAGVFSDAFVDHLFELVEQTREMEDETFNYSVIKLIVSLPSVRPGIGSQQTVSLGCT